MLPGRAAIYSVDHLSAVLPWFDKSHRDKRHSDRLGDEVLSASWDALHTLFLLHSFHACARYNFWFHAAEHITKMNAFTNHCIADYPSALACVPNMYGRPAYMHLFTR